MKTLRVLVPLDGSELSRAILPFVRGLPRATITPVRVADDGVAGAEEEPGEARAIVRRGKPAEEILAVASEVGVDLIAMTTHGRTGFDRLVLGSVAEKVIRASEVPVLALRAPEPSRPEAAAVRPFGRVLVPCDGSASSLRAIDALALLDDERASKLEVFGVVETYAGPTMIPAEASHDFMVEFQRLRRDGLRRDIDRAVAHARALGFEAEGAVEIGVPAAAILERAAKLPATLIAMTTHGRSGPSRWALGSVTEKVLRASTTPLLICK